MSNFHQASNFVIEHLNQTDVRVDIEQQKQKGDFQTPYFCAVPQETHENTSAAFERLLGEIVQGASFDAGERFDAPACHPETRTAVLDDIKSWVNNDNESTRIMWLNGPAGAGKSAVAQTTADDFHSEGKLVASFFFSRFTPGRNTKNGLIATIAFQLSVSIPEIKEHIIDAIVKNPNIFKSNIKTQFQTLVVDPYSHLSEAENGTTTRPRLILIDGLDECEYSDHQAEIINALGTSLKKNCTSRLRILIASRPEPRIRQTFDDEVISTICIRLTLDDKYNPDEDIELYLRSSLQTLKRHHILAPALKSWPPESSIQQIVDKSSGQFIYAATVVKYISDPQQNPIKRLDIVLNIKDAGGERPFAQLDALYTAILSNIRRDHKKVALIFEAIMYLPVGEFIKHYSNPMRRRDLLSASFLDEFLHLENETRLILADLSSIVDTSMEEEIGLRFFHASFIDYLEDRSRSQKIYIDEHQAYVHLAICCANRIAGPPGSEIVSEYSVRAIFDHYRSSNYDDKVLESVLSNGLLSVEGVQLFHMRQYSKLYEHFPDTFLGMFVELNPNREEAKDSLRDAIDSAFRNHLQRYDPHHLLIIYSFAPCDQSLRPIKPLYLVPALNDIPFKQNVLFDVYHLPVRIWFVHLIRDNLVHFSQEAHIKSACFVLEVYRGAILPDDRHVSAAAQKVFSYLSVCINKWDPLKFTSEFIDNLPDTIEIANTIFRKWESMSPTSEQLTEAPDVNRYEYRMMDNIIQAYYKRSLKHDVVGVQTDTNEHLSTAAENLAEDTRTTGNYTALNKFLIMLIILIAYMYMHINGACTSSSAM